MEKQVILVNERDEEQGVAAKLLAHEKGWLHRAFSIFIFNEKGEMLLQQRAMNKYHSGGLWTNTCCSHPEPGEDTREAAYRRLKEEMGFETDIEKVFDFVYREGFENGLIEYEFDHVYTGEYRGRVHINKEEVMDYRFSNMREIGDSIRQKPSQYTAWFRIAFPKIESWWSNRYINTIAS